MLVLSRKVGEEIIIEGSGRTVIRVVHVNAEGSQVKLGLEAPREITINRAEVGLRISSEPPNRWPASTLSKVVALTPGHAQIERL